MSQFSLFGVGAGRTIAGEIVDDDDRSRQRRLTSAQRVEQDRRIASLRERLAQSEQATISTTHQQAPYPKGPVSTSAYRDAKNNRLLARIDPEMPENRFRALSRESDDVSDLELGSDSVDLYEPSPRRTRLAEDLAWPKIDRSQDTNSSKPKFPTGELSTATVPNALVSAAKALPTAIEEKFEVNAGLGESMPVFEHGASGVGTPLARLTALVDDLDKIRGPQFAENLTNSLNALLETIRHHPTPNPNSNDAEDINGTLEFLEGYVEASTLKEEDQQPLSQLMGQLRQELVGEHYASSATQALILSAAASSSVGESSRLSGNASEARVGSRGRSTLGERVALAKADNESEEMEKELAVSQLQSGVGGPIRSLKSNLSKDADKRREETLASITVRSV